MDQAVKNLKASFADCQELLLALGDENRQNILLALADKSCQESGLRVNEITQKVNLSRPAVSHHLKILREAGLINLREEGTKNFYSADIQTNFWKLQKMIEALKAIGVVNNDK